MIRALIVEDAPLLRSGIRLFLKDEPDVELVGSLATGRKRLNASMPYAPM